MAEEIVIQPSTDAVATAIAVAALIVRQAGTSNVPKGVPLWEHRARTIGEAAALILRGATTGGSPPTTSPSGAAGGSPTT
jgi:hypothetical protein